MRTTSLCFVLIALAAHLNAADPGDPSHLAVPAEKTARGEELIRQLDDDDVRVRDAASEALTKMGRFALPAIRSALAAKPTVEVKNRIQRLMPAVAGDDFSARYPVFLADSKRKFDHDFLGWSELKAIAEDTEQSRALFADMLASEQARDMLLALAKTPHEALDLFQDRWAYFGRKFDKVKGWHQITPPLPELAGLFLAQSQVRGQHPKFDGGRSFLGVEASLKTDEGKLAALGKGKYGTVFQAVCRRWVETREHQFSFQFADGLCRAVNLGEELRTENLLRLLASPNVHPAVKYGQLMVLAEKTGRKHLAVFRKLFDDDSQVLPGDEEQRMQVRDMALVAAVLVTDQKPKDYGYTIVVDEKPERKFMDYNYRFTERNGKSLDDLRKVAFAKWAEWEKANLKPDERKK